MEGRRQIVLSPDDTEYLDNAFPGNWESISEGYVLIDHFPIRPGFTTNEVTAAIQIPSNYPVVPLDMVYFYPAVLRSDGQTIPATEATQGIDGKVFQRWSRHYRPGTWIPGESNLATHVLAIGDWLERALSGKVAG